MGRSKWILAVSAFVITFGLTVAVGSGGLGSSPPTTLDRTIVPNGEASFGTLEIGPGEDYGLRDAMSDGAGFGEAQAGRFERRRHLSYFGQLTDIHLTDEESPARVEFLDPDGGAFSSAWRPGEAMGPFEAKTMVDRMNQLASGSPNGAGKRMDFLVNSGDVADNQQYNEVLWNRQLLEGGTIDPGSGTDPTASIGTNPLCPVGLEIQDGNDPDAYTGVQDIDDWEVGTPGYFYDPDQPAPFGPDPEEVSPYWAAPTWPGLMDRAQEPFTSPGADVPTYVLAGNHDGLVQGNAWATSTFNQLATGCLKPLNDATENSGISNGPLFDLVVNPNLTVDGMLDLYEQNPDLFVGVPPDPDRRLISKKSFKQVFQSGSDPRGHGFDLVDRAELRASAGTASYYSFSPRRGLRVVVLDTVSEGGRIFSSSSGNIDAPQFSWLEGQLQKATRSNELVVVFSHHPISSLTADVPDEEAPSCAEVDAALAVGCDSDPRGSTPVKLSSDASSLMHRFPHAIAWIAGHTHQNRIRPYTAPGGESGFWSIETSSLADWPKQGRLVDLFDNRDGTLSLFTTMVDHAAPVSTPADGTPASGMSVEEISAIGRTVSFNDTQGGSGGEGQADDRNVEMVMRDPRRTEPTLYLWGPKPTRVGVKAGRKATVAIRVTNEGRSSTGRTKVVARTGRRDLLVGSPARIPALEVGQTTTIRVKVRAVRGTRGKRPVTVTVAGRSITIPVTVRR
jgi:3',5'-cyclic AMP phosphodiesterase CpdA